MIKNPNTLETGLNKQTTPAMAETDITHDVTERNRIVHYRYNENVVKEM
jgi:hypothetical protein